ncbi:hypothetical protein VPH35_078021 [Triticum aestivum]|uniref:uncharacterized protein isoform X1 n=1 Tax=Triticum aestivum TaxID=4565 RepID=UPI000843EECD|nr:uncharacterized protein LOC123097423 isoform X1 [Triticum aestivum]
MASLPGACSDLFAVPLLRISAPIDPEQLPGESQDEVASMEVTHSHFSSYAAWYKQYENSRHGSEAVPAIVKIPYRMVLDVLLETLGLPEVEYRTRVYDGSRVCVTVLFYRTTSYVGNDIPGVQFVDQSMPEDSAAMEAIGYIKCTVKTEITDYNYSTMKKLEEENRSLKHELYISRYNK